MEEPMNVPSRDTPAAGKGTQARRLAQKRGPDAGRTVHLPRSERRLVEQSARALELVRGKWKVHLLFLMARGVHRHCTLLKGLRVASKKMMTDTLRALEHDGLVRREVHAEVPLRVEYSLTPLGWAIINPLMALAEWDETHHEDIECARLRHRLGDSQGRRELHDHSPGVSETADCRACPPQAGRTQKLATNPAGLAVVERPRLVVFCSARSGSSRRAEGFLANVLQRRHNHETFRLFRVEADTRPDLVERFRVAEIPTLLVVTDRRIRGRLSNPRGCAEISQFLSPWLK
jgi:DNA-binding HxlR family transcriptional regulator